MRDYAPWQSEHASEVIAEHRHRDGAMLPMLHALQDVFGYVPEAAVPMVAAGGDALAARAQAKLDIGLGETTPDRRVTLEATYCLGLCACAPSAMLDGRVVGRLDERRLDALLVEAQR